MYTPEQRTPIKQYAAAHVLVGSRLSQEEDDEVAEKRIKKNTHKKKMLRMKASSSREK